jgi:hypothetical protein
MHNSTTVAFFRLHTACMKQASIFRTEEDEAKHAAIILMKPKHVSPKSR